MKPTNRFDRIFDRILNMMMVVSGILLGVTLVIVCLEVVFRYFLHRPLGWSAEVSSYMLLYITFLVAAWVLKDNGHVTLDVVVTMFSSRIQYGIAVVTSILSAIVCLIIIWFGMRVTLDLFLSDYRTPTLLRFPEFFIIVLIPFGSLVLFVQLLRMIAGYLSKWKSPTVVKEKGVEKTGELW